jgi:hypothetical protein
MKPNRKLIVVSSLPKTAIKRHTTEIRKLLERALNNNFEKRAIWLD